MPVENWTSNQIEELVAFRRDLHQNPELLYDVSRTAEKVAEALRAAGVDEVVTGIGRTGVVGVIRGQSNRSPGHRPARRYGRPADPRGNRRGMVIESAGQDACLRT